MSVLFQGCFVRHPTLGVVVCKNCKSFYYEGSWSKDEEGKFEYCGWCAQGGELFCCTLDHCPNTFCTKCVKRNLGCKVVSIIENCCDWQCFECKPEQLLQQRLLYYSILNLWKKQDEKLDNMEKAKSQKEKFSHRKRSCESPGANFVDEGSSCKRREVSEPSTSEDYNSIIEPLTEELTKQSSFDKKMVCLCGLSSMITRNSCLGKFMAKKEILENVAKIVEKIVLEDKREDLVMIARILVQIEQTEDG